MRERNYVPESLNSLPCLDHDRLILVTAHRRESFGKPLREICEAVRIIAQRYRDVNIIYPVHLNPNVKTVVYSSLSDQKGVHLIPPVNYKDLCYLMNRCDLILTDSGGIQEEAPSLRKPVLVMRNTTERPEAVDAGVAKLVGTARESIINAVEKLLEDSEEYSKMTSSSNPFGDGKASERIVNILLGRPYEPFQPG